MRSNAPTISNHRIARVSQWARLWLKWFAAFLRVAGPLAAPAERLAHAWLNQFHQLVPLIILTRASLQCRPVLDKRYDPTQRDQPSGLRRAMIGVALHRRLRRRDIGAGIAALLDLLTDPSAAIRALTRRLARGLTRRIRTFTPAPAGVGLASPFRAPAPLAYSDTS